MDIVTKIFDICSQEGCDGEPYDTLQEAGEEILKLRHKLKHRELIMCKPPSNTKAGTLHVLSNRHAKTKIKVFEWTGEAWSTPNTGYSTMPAAMAVLGWKYERPA